jgi:hypothetical protein
MMPFTDASNIWRPSHIPDADAVILQRDGSTLVVWPAESNTGSGRRAALQPASMQLRTPATQQHMFQCLMPVCA